MLNLEPLGGTDRLWLMRTTYNDIDGVRDCDTSDPREPFITTLFREDTLRERGRGGER